MGQSLCGGCNARGGVEKKNPFDQSMSCSYFAIQGIPRIPLYESLMVVMIMLSGVVFFSSLRLISYAEGHLEPSNPDIV